ncbi:MAG TPA: TIGR01620 family protein, partial [Pantoea agglomerans]|nr:TIGR01620 family protein [Pantoea agglomerans]
MSDPLKPRIDFARPLDERSTTPLRPAQTVEADAQAAFRAAPDVRGAGRGGGAGGRSVG